MMSRADEAIEYIKSLDIGRLGRGRFDVDDDFYYSVLEYDISATGPEKLESHRKWIDIQWIVEGQEIPSPLANLVYISLFKLYNTISVSGMQYY